MYNDWKNNPMNIGDHVIFIDLNNGRTTKFNEGDILDFKIIFNKEKAKVRIGNSSIFKYVDVEKCLLVK